MRRLVLLSFLALSQPLQAEEVNLSAEPTAGSGAVTRQVLAHQTLQNALTTGDAVLLVAAIRLARSVVLRPPTSWERTTLGEAAADQPVGRGLMPDPGGPEVGDIARSFAAETPDLLDFVFYSEPGRPEANASAASEATADLGGGQTDTWRLPFFGEVPAELALIGDSDTALSLKVTDAAGNALCVHPPGLDPVVCRFTPARNGFFEVEVANTGTVQNSYRLIGS
jgi:hypothetical protein